MFVGKLRIFLYTYLAREHKKGSARPVSSPLAATLHNVDKLTSDDAVCLLTRVQLVVPHEAVWARVVGTVHVVSVAGDIEGRGAVEVL